jgi:hypothetical protein
MVSTRPPEGLLTRTCTSQGPSRQDVTGISRRASAYKIVQGPSREEPRSPEETTSKHARACAAEMHMDMPQEQFYARIYKENDAPQDRDNCFVRALRNRNELWTLQKSHIIREFSRKMPRPKINSRGRLCASPRSRNAHGHVTRAIPRENLQENCRRPAGAP